MRASRSGDADWTSRESHLARVRFALRLAAMFLGLLVLAEAPVRAQDIGHRVPGTLGLNAGKQAEPGLYLADQAALYVSDGLRDRSGNFVPVSGFRLRAWANGFGVAGAFALGPIFYNPSVSAPAAHVRLTSDVPQASLDRFGLADVRAQPLGVGWRSTHVDLIGSYALYIPTSHYEPGGRGGLGRGGFSHEFSLGGAVYFDRKKNWYFTALASYELNHRKIGIDITRGDTLQVQGGAGTRIQGVVDVGVVGYALWQVRDDRGIDLPQALRGSRDRVFGLGPEVGVLVKPIRTRFALRYESDFGVRARPEGQIVTLTAILLLWQPRASSGKRAGNGR